MKKIISIALLLTLLVMVMVPIAVAADTGGQVTDLGYLWLALAAWGGGLLAALLGWAKSGEVFVARKFLISVLMAFLAAGVAALAYPVIDKINWAIIIGAVLYGAGVDVVSNRTVGTIVSGVKAAISPTTTGPSKP
ncbi:MAG: hypothetical protein ABSF21_00915 [Dehalococcoidia bacterium]